MGGFHCSHTSLAVSALTVEAGSPGYRFLAASRHNCVVTRASRLLNLVPDKRH